VTTQPNSKDEQYDALISMVPYDEDKTVEEMQQELKKARKVIARRHIVSPDNFRVTPNHNHFTRDIKPRGVCPACDKYHDKT
jgi:predicted naringenin-chalcone synthase